MGVVVEWLRQLCTAPEVSMNHALDLYQRLLLVDVLDKASHITTKHAETRDVLIVLVSLLIRLDF